MNTRVHESAGFGGVDTPNPESPFVVMKFGGRSVATAKNWSFIVGLLQNRIAEGLKPVVVHSALAGVSNALEELLVAAVANGAEEHVDHVHAVHGLELGGKLAGTS